MGYRREGSNAKRLERRLLTSILKCWTRRWESGLRGKVSLVEAFEPTLLTENDPWVERSFRCILPFFSGWSILVLLGSESKPRLSASQWDGHRDSAAAQHVLCVDAFLGAGESGEPDPDLGGLLHRNTENQTGQHGNKCDGGNTVM